MSFYTGTNPWRARVDSAICMHRYLAVNWGLDTNKVSLSPWRISRCCCNVPHVFSHAYNICAPRGSQFHHSSNNTAQRCFNVFKIWWPPSKHWWAELTRIFENSTKDDLNKYITLERSELIYLGCTCLNLLLFGKTGLPHSHQEKNSLCFPCALSLFPVFFIIFLVYKWPLPHLQPSFPPFITNYSTLKLH